jgi:putative transcriptional regulator
MTRKKRVVARKKRSLFRELMSGVEAMRAHREGRVTLKTTDVQPISVPPIDADVVRETREALNMSRQVFAFKLGVNPRTLERWEQGRSKPNEQAAALIWLVRKYPDTLKRLESLAASA